MIQLLKIIFYDVKISFSNLFFQILNVSNHSFKDLNVKNLKVPNLSFLKDLNVNITR